MATGSVISPTRLVRYLAVERVAECVLTDRDYGRLSLAVLTVMSVGDQNFAQYIQVASCGSEILNCGDSRFFGSHGCDNAICNGIALSFQFDNPRQKSVINSSCSSTSLTLRMVERAAPPCEAATAAEYAGLANRTGRPSTFNRTLLYHSSSPSHSNARRPRPIGGAFCLHESNYAS